ncbi:MAG: spore maturation protein [Chitinophagaceae bacterium]|nr:spore maturation protein [Chitinophagaceae bacterium]
MALSRIWSAFIIVAIVVAGFQFFLGYHPKIFSQMVIGKQGDTLYSRAIEQKALPLNIANELINKSEVKLGNDKYYKLNDNEFIVSKEQQANGILTTCKDAVDICIGLIGIMALFMGLMSIAEKAGGIRFLSRVIRPFFSKLFPEVPKDHPAFGHMMLNYSANLLNLDNAATPFGIKAMQSLQELNPDKDRASNAQIMFLSLHAAGLTLIPVSIIAIRSKMGAANATDIFIPCLITTFIATVAAMIIVSIKQKINLLQPAILAWVMGISAIILALVLYVHQLSKEHVDGFSSALGNGILVLIILLIVLGGVYKKIDVFDSFVDGAKEGFNTSIKIIPYLVGMLVAISMLRTSGTFDVILLGMKNVFVLMGFDTRFVEALPTALVRPLSGSGARGMMVDTIRTYGVDSFPGRLSSVMQGCSDTTFYIIAIYYGSIAVKNVRYSITAMLLADLVGIITAILLSYMFFT